MKKLRHMGMVKRDLSYPIIFCDHTIPASPGDTLASAILANNLETLVPPHFFNHTSSIAATRINELNFQETCISRLLHLESFLHREVYPGFVMDFLKSDYQVDKDKVSTETPILDFSIKDHDAIGQFPKKELLKSLFNAPMSILRQANCADIREAVLFADIECLSVEVLVVGAGVAGLVAALTSSNAGMQVLLLESDFIIGGSLNSLDRNNSLWLKKSIAELESNRNVRISTRTQVLKKDRDGWFLAIEKSYQQDKKHNIRPIYKLFKIKAKHAFIATGATERIPLSLSQNISGIMSTTIFSNFVNRFGLGPNDGVTVYTNNDSGWRVVKQLIELGIKVDAVIDTRPGAKMVADCPVFRGARIIDTVGRSELCAVIIRDLYGQRKKIRTSLLAVSGGYTANFGVINHDILNLKWCPLRATFKAQVNNSDIILLGGANADFCPKRSIDIAYQAVKKLVKSKGLKTPQCDFPSLGEMSYDCLLSNHDGTRFQQNWISGMLKKNATDFVDFFAKDKDNFEKTTSRFDKLKSDALKLFSSHSEEVSLIKSITKEENLNRSFSKTVFEMSTSAHFVQKEGGQTLKPFRALPCHSDHEKLGANWYMVGEWLVPEHFSQSKIVQHKRDIAELEMTHALESVGVSDISDLGKIEVSGKNASRFIFDCFALIENKIQVDEYQEGYLITAEGTVFDQATFLRTGNESYLLTISNYNEKKLYNYLCERLAKLPNYIDLRIHLATDIHQVYSLVGPLACEVLARAFTLDSSFLKLKRMEVKSTNFQGYQCAICHNKERKLSRFKLFVFSTLSKQVFSQICNSIRSLKGAVIGRYASEMIELESGQIPTRKLQQFFNNPGAEKKNDRDFDSKTLNKLLKFECHKKNRFSSRIAFLQPNGPTKNIVEGSEVRAFGGQNKASVLGRVVASYFSRMQGTFVAYVLLEQPGSFDRKPVFVPNQGKNYLTKCELSSFDSFNLGDTR